jgi:uncharacterized protein (DUF1330 family)
MINILVSIEVKSFTILAKFEHIAVKIMRFHGGDIISAFETLRNEDGSGQETHILAFPTENAFLSYRTDPRLLEHADLRDKAIKSTSIVTSTTIKHYI